jgi:transcriptional regulator GlxA family with amidase domain
VERHRLVVLLFDNVLPLDFAIPMQMFAREAPDFYEVHTASVGGGSVRFAGGSSVVVDGGIELLSRAQTIIVPGYDSSESVQIDESALLELRNAAGRGVRIASICSGAFALARAGLLNGLTVTTHWALSDELARGFPEVTVNAAALVIDNEQILTSGGVMAGVDLVLHILRKDRGPSFANHMARRIVMAPRPEGSQGQFRELPSVASGDEAIDEVQTWMLDSLDRSLTVGDLAVKAHLSARQLHRRFLEATGQSPLAWLLDRRIARARELLETTDVPMETIARAVGLGTAANFRAQFRRSTGVPPRGYRQSFRASTSLGVA